MDVLFAEIADRLDALHSDMMRTIAGLPIKALDWSPGPEMNSLVVLAVHTAGAERFWIGDMVGQVPSGRDRGAEFHALGWDEARLLARLDDVLAHSRNVLEHLSRQEMEATRISPRDGREFTVAWCLLHALEHDAVHLGHMQIVRQLWEMSGQES
jgi:uncharacterized damage-inducible protein DinB